MMNAPTIPPRANKSQKLLSILTNRSDTGTPVVCTGMYSAAAAIKIASAARNVNWTASVHITARRPPSVT